MLAIIAVSLTAIFISIRYRVRSSVAAVPGIPAEGDGGASQSSQRGPSVAGAALWWCNAFAVTVIRVTDGTGIRHFVTTITGEPVLF